MKQACSVKIAHSLHLLVLTHPRETAKEMLAFLGSGKFASQF
ncbi:hypothetical protein [Brevibacillus sp. H7]